MHQNSHRLTTWMRKLSNCLMSFSLGPRPALRLVTMADKLVSPEFHVVGKANDEGQRLSSLILSATPLMSTVSPGKPLGKRSKISSCKFFVMIGTTSCVRKFASSNHELSTETKAS